MTRRRGRGFGSRIEKGEDGVDGRLGHSVRCSLPGGPYC